MGKALLFSPLIGFVASALLFLALKTPARNKAPYERPKDGVPPPPWIRALLIFTCTGVSFAHGANDGQKGMGLVMLILIGTVRTAYALNSAMPAENIAAFVDASEQVVAGVDGGGAAVVDPETELPRFLETRQASP